MIQQALSSLSRRDFLWISTLTGAAVVTGCATNPVTGERQLMLVSENEEINIDQTYSPHQFSADYGATQDGTLNEYVTQVGEELCRVSHRPHMPYSFRVVNAAYPNAYAFPGGSIAVTRRLMTEMENEAQLTAVLGHEIGHVTARHGAAQMSQGMAASIVVAGLTALAEAKNKDYAPIVAGLGSLGSGYYLARYSRADERQADALGMEYCVKAGYNPQGVVGVMSVLRRLSQGDSNLLERMFASHPMSEERYQTALTAVNQPQYAAARQLPEHRERWMDRTTNLRKLKPALDAMEKGEKALVAGKAEAARDHLRTALQLAPEDYAALMLMSKCCLALKQNQEAQRYASAARDVYPREAQAYHVSGMAALNSRSYQEALSYFEQYQELLPGNPNVLFYQGRSFEGMGRRQSAAEKYTTFIQQAEDQGDEFQHAQKRLIEWGYLKQQKSGS